MPRHNHRNFLFPFALLVFAASIGVCPADEVRVWEEPMTLPTYEVGPA